MVRGTELESEVGEGAVCLGHLMHLVTLPDGGTLVLGRVLDLVGEGDMHRHTTTGAGMSDDPAHGEGLLTLDGDLKRHLVGLSLIHI